MIVIGDIHGLDFWKRIVSKCPDEEFVFLGDYCDPYEYIPQRGIIQNLKDIIEFKKSNSDKVTLLLGNHDTHYFVEQSSQSSRYNEYIAKLLGTLFTKNRECFQYALQKDTTIFTHAGISKLWFETRFKGDYNDNIAEQINNAREEQFETLFDIGTARGGNKISGGILWADTDELNSLLPNYTQIVGHNKVEEIQRFTDKKSNADIVFCDALHNGCYLQIPDKDM